MLRSLLHESSSYTRYCPYVGILMAPRTLLNGSPCSRKVIQGLHTILFVQRLFQKEVDSKMYFTSSEILRAPLIKFSVMSHSFYDLYF